MTLVVFDDEEFLSAFRMLNNDFDFSSKPFTSFTEDTIYLLKVLCSTYCQSLLLLYDSKASLVIIADYVQISCSYLSIDRKQRE